MINSRSVALTFSIVLIAIVLLVTVSSAESSRSVYFGEPKSAPQKPSLTASLFFDGSNDSRFVSSNFREPVVDSLGRLRVVADTGNISCSFGFCGYRLYSINPDGTLGWQAPADGGFLSSDSFALRSVFIAPNDRAYVLDRGSVFA